MKELKDVMVVFLYSFNLNLKLNYLMYIYIRIGKLFCCLLNLFINNGI